MSGSLRLVYQKKRLKKVASGKFRIYESSQSKESITQLIERGGSAEPISSGIRIFKPILPNKFWFAVPEGLVTLDEVPEYAGLYYVSE